MTISFVFLSIRTGAHKKVLMLNNVHMASSPTTDVHACHASFVVLAPSAADVIDTRAHQGAHARAH